MYEKHIEAFETLAANFEQWAPHARAAIALMRAAEPKDPKAEREHCDQAVALAPRSGDFLSLAMDCWKHEQEARAEERLKFETKLSAAHAEISDLRVRLNVEQHSHKTEERRADELTREREASK